MQGIMLNPANAQTPPTFQSFINYSYYNGLTFPNISSNRLECMTVHPVLSKLGFFSQTRPLSQVLDECAHENNEWTGQF